MISELHSKRFSLPFRLSESEKERHEEACNETESENVSRAAL